MRPQRSKERSNENWIIFSYFFNIDGKASSQHIDDRVPHLASLGINPYVLSSVCGKRSRGVAHYRVPSVAPSGVRFELRYLKRRNRVFKLAFTPLLIAVLPLYLIEKAVINLESEWSWFAPAFLRGLQLCRRFRPAIVYSTGGPASAHLAAGLVANCMKVPWIAELQDPIVFKDWARSKTALKINSRLERFIFDKASAVVFLTEGARERAVRRNGADAAKTHVIYPGASQPDELQPIDSKGEVCRFAHFGSMGGSRNPAAFLEGLQIVLDQNPDLAAKVRFDVYGTTDSASGRLIAGFKYPGVVTDFGKMSRLEALIAMRKSDVLLLIQNLDDISYETIPSKVYEYLQMNRPILALVYRNPQFEKMLLEQGHWVVQADSPAEIGAHIKRIIGLWRTAGLERRSFPASPYTVRSAAERLLEISDRVFSDP
jgi:hypothetical protein